MTTRVCFPQGSLTCTWQQEVSTQSESSRLFSISGPATRRCWTTQGVLWCWRKTHSCPAHIFIWVAITIIRFFWLVIEKLIKVDDQRYLGRREARLEGEDYYNFIGDNLICHSLSLEWSRWSPTMVKPLTMIIRWVHGGCEASLASSSDPVWGFSNETRRSFASKVPF